MKNTELKTTIQNTLTGAVREDARIEYTQCGNGYCVCIRVPHLNQLTGRTEYSLPATFKAWGIQSEQSIRRTVAEFLRYNKHLAA